MTTSIETTASEPPAKAEIKTNSAAQRNATALPSFKLEIFKSAFSSELTSNAILVLLCWLCYANTLLCSFVRDDFPPISFMHHAFAHDPAALLAKYVQPWQSTEIQLLYRPLSEASLQLDYLLWQANAFGFHLTNIFWHICATLLLYQVMRTIFRRRQSDAHAPHAGTQPTIAFWTAAIFAVHPIHVETTAWIIARVDSIAATFYLLSFLLFLRGGKTATTLSLISFAAAILAKESSITLPVMIGIYTAFFGAPSGESPWRAILLRLKLALKAAAPCMVLVVPYFLMRYLILGTPVGGYVGSIGDCFQTGWMYRVLSPYTLGLFFPFDAPTFHSNSPDVWCMRAAYAVGALALLLSPRATWSDDRSQLTTFLAVWIVVALLPSLPVFYLSPNLGGGRLYYIASMGLCALYAIILLWKEPSNAIAKAGTRPSFRELCGFSSLALFVIAFASMTIRENNNWIDAGHQTKQVRDATQVYMARYPSQTIILCNSITTDNGEALFCHFPMLEANFKPPFAAVDLGQRIAALELTTFLQENLLNKNAVQRAVNSPNYHLALYDESEQRVVPANLDLSFIEDRPLKFIDAQRRGSRFVEHQGRSYFETEFRLPPDVIPEEVDTIYVKLPYFEWRASQQPLMAIDWQCPKRNSDDIACMQQPVSGQYNFFHVSECRRWVFTDDITSLKVLLPADGENLDIECVTLLCGGTHVAKLREVPGTTALNRDSTINLIDGSGQFRYDASLVPNVKEAILEISKPSQCFEHYSRTFHDPDFNEQPLRRLLLPQLKGVVKLQQSDLSKGPTQIRLFALDRNGLVVGTSSYPITIR
jgi:hypothetical protein